MAYAENTTVAFEKSISEVISHIKKHGAERIGQVEEAGFFALQFLLSERMIRFHLPFKSIDDMPVHDGRRQRLTTEKRQALLNQSKRQRGRALQLVIKAKLESVESGIETVEEAFLSNVVMADGSTVYERAKTLIAIEYQTGEPNVTLGLLPPPKGPDNA